MKAAYHCLRNLRILLCIADFMCFCVLEKLLFFGSLMSFVLKSIWMFSYVKTISILIVYFTPICLRLALCSILSVLC